MEIKRTERGWCGHFICGHECRFRRNTLIEYGKIRIVVSTVGNLVLHAKTESIGHNRWYETMAFHARYEKPYWEADATRQVAFVSEWSICSSPKHETDKQANDMHEDVVTEIMGKLENGK